MKDDRDARGWDPTRPAHGAGPGDSRARRDAAAQAEEGEEGGGALTSHLEELAGLAARSGQALAEPMERYARWVIETLERGGKLLFCGNGGSAATVEHVAAEYVVRFRRVRRSLPALALTASSAATTAAGNDFGFEEVFARQLRGHAGPDDLLIVHSTSGESENAVRAVEAATELGLRSVGLLAAGGGRLAEMVSLPIVVPTDRTAAAQEIHLAVEHAVADRADAHFAGGRG